MRILVTGGNGNLAKIIVKHLSTEFNIMCITRKDFDLLKLQELTNYLSGKNFDVLIHTAISGGRRTKEENGCSIPKFAILTK
jgi:dTDP-4-dehydrorhamnose reductase